jgi:hypothetical protein
MHWLDKLLRALRQRFQYKKLPLLLLLLLSTDSFSPSGVQSRV